MTGPGQACQPWLMSSEMCWRTRPRDLTATTWDSMLVLPQARPLRTSMFTSSRGIGVTFRSDLEASVVRSPVALTTVQGQLQAAQPPSGRALRSGPDHPLLPALADAISVGAVARADLVIAFVLDSGVARLMPHLEAILDSGGSVRILTSDYLNGTQSAALERLWHRQREYGDRFSVRVFFTQGGSSFHPKVYLLGDGPSGYRVGFVGSANASVSGLLTGVEWSLESRDPAALAEAHDAFQALWADRRSVDLSRSVIDDWVDRPMGGGAHSSTSTQDAFDEPTEVEEPVLEPVAPTVVQKQALAALELTRADGFGAGLVVMATGLGKTWLAAFDATRPEFRRVLFVAHREEILQQTREVFRAIRPDSTVGLVMGTRTTQTLTSSWPRCSRCRGGSAGCTRTVRLRRDRRVPPRRGRQLPAGCQPSAPGLPAGFDGDSGQGRWRGSAVTCARTTWSSSAASRKASNVACSHRSHYLGVPDPVDFAATALAQLPLRSRCVRDMR